MLPFRFDRRALGFLSAVSLLLSSFVGVPTAFATALEPSLDGPGFTLRVNTGSFGFANITPEFSNVRRFEFELDFDRPLLPGSIYTNDDLLEVRYLVRGGLSTNPPTPSGFPAFLLSRLASGEGVISAEEWRAQSSEVAFRLAQQVNVLDGLQLSELQPIDKQGRILEIDAREWARLDRARYHPPQLWLNPDGTGLLRNSNNDSKDTGTVNPATLEEVRVDYGDEYITRIAFDPSAVTIVDAPNPTPVVPEPGTALLFGLGLIGLARAGRR